MSGEWDERRPPTLPSAAPPPQQPPIGWAPAPPPGSVPPPLGSGSGGGPRWLVVAAVVLVVVVGAGAAVVVTSDDDDPAVAPADLRLDDLRPVLLTQDDLGGDWEPIDDAEQSESVEPDVSEECRRAMEERAPDARGVAPSLNAIFWQGPTGGTPIVTHLVALLDEDMASFEDLRETADVCREYTVDDGDVTTTTVQRLVAAEGPGDEVLAYETDSTTTYDDGSQPPSLTHGYDLYVRRDGVMSVVHMTGGFEDAVPSDGEVRESGPADVDLVHQLAERIDERLRAALE